ncbi:amidohydrolase, partial [Streptomyces sp. SID11233]|nr:amidohydrolase [Streptomyces sp. SID11233]
FAAYGVTTALDMGTWPVSRVDALRGLPGLTDIRSSTYAATSPASGHAAHMGLPEGSLVAAPADAERFVTERVAEGADHIKLII